MSNEKKCRMCNGPIIRKTYNGKLESLPIYNERKYCGQECAGMGRRAVMQGQLRWDNDPVQVASREARDLLLPLNRLVASRFSL